MAEYILKTKLGNDGYEHHIYNERGHIAPTNLNEEITYSEFVVNNNDDIIRLMKKMKSSEFEI